ncbi:MAG: hypothetical protein D6B28_07940 [Gammaproteobacteria bacterium]|nr:MAG: hypothetical protein D6B28_07940 [Gammaproteobacteria bacterium]
MKNINILLANLVLTLTFSASVFAENEANQHFKRLFLPPEFRTKIDLYRNNPDLYKPKEVIVSDKGEEPATEIPAKSTIIVKGIITKPDGSKVAWIDNKPSAQEVSEQEGTSQNVVLVKLDSQTSVQLKAGQIYNAKDNSVKEIFNYIEEVSEGNNSEEPYNSTDKMFENGDQSVEEPNEITKTLIDIVNSKKAAKQMIDQGIEP